MSPDELALGCMDALHDLYKAKIAKLEAENEKLKAERDAMAIALDHDEESDHSINAELKAEVARLTKDLKRATEDELRFCVPGCPSRIGDKCTKFNIDIFTCGGAPYQREIERKSAVDAPAPITPGSKAEPDNAQHDAQHDPTSTGDGKAAVPPDGVVEVNVYGERVKLDGTSAVTTNHAVDAHVQNARSLVGEEQMLDEIEEEKRICSMDHALNLDLGKAAAPTNLCDCGHPQECHGVDEFGKRWCINCHGKARYHVFKPAAGERRPCQ